MRKALLFRLPMWVLPSLLLVATSAAQSIRYNIRTLDSLGGGTYDEGGVRSVNNSGQAVGFVTYGSFDPIPRALLWREDGSAIDLQPLQVGYGGETRAPGKAFAINNIGQVVGLGHGPPEGACLWQNGIHTDLSIFGGWQSEARGINDAGEIVGWGLTPDGWERAFLWRSGVVTDLGTLGGGTARAYNINKASQVVGESWITNNGPLHAFLWQQGVMRDLGSLPGYTGGHDSSTATDINDAGQVVGYCKSSRTNIYPRAFIWQNGSMTDLGALGTGGTWAYAVNNLGQVVGTSNGRGRAFLWQSGAMTDLNSLIDPSSGWQLTEALDINDNGWIVGKGIGASPGRILFLLVPVPEDIPNAKKSRDGDVVAPRAGIVTRVLGDDFYIESGDRAAAIRVHRPAHALAIGARVNVIGRIRTNTNGERYVEASTVTQYGSGSVRPVGLAIRLLGGADWAYNPATGAGQRGVKGGLGLNNIGLLIRVWGEVTYRGSDFFYLDDGSGSTDASGHVGARVLAQGINLPALGSHVQVTGISSCFISGTELFCLILLTRQDDILPEYLSNR